MYSYPKQAGFAVGQLVDHRNGVLIDGVVLGVSNFFANSTTLVHVQWPNGNQGDYEPILLIDSHTDNQKRLAYGFKPRNVPLASFMPSAHVYDGIDALKYAFASSKPKCECGAHKTQNQNCHADWCPISPCKKHA